MITKGVKRSGVVTCRRASASSKSTNITNHQIRRHVSAYAPQSGAAVPQQRLFLTQYEIEEADRRISGPRAIPRIRKPTKELFASGIRAAGRERTVILSHTMDDWKGMERWKDPSFFKQLGDLKTMIPVEMVVPESPKDSPKVMQSMMKLHEFIDVFLLKTAKPRRSITGGETPSLAWHRGHLTDQFTILQDDHNVPVFVQSTPADKLYQSSSLWAPANTPTFLHRDPFHTMVAQVVGHQYVRIYPADQMQYIYPHPDPFNRNTSLIRSPMLDRFHGDATATATTTSFAEEQSNLDLASRFPLLSQATYMECVLKPGELLYIPQGYWYFAKTLSYTFALSFQFAEMHEDVSLDIDVNKRLVKGSAALHFQFIPGTHLPIKQLSLHCRHAVILDVTANKIACKATLRNYMAQVVPPSSPYTSLEGFRPLLKAAGENSDEGELLVEFPEELIQEMGRLAGAAVAANANAKAAAAASAGASAAQPLPPPTPQLPPPLTIVIQIDYTLKDPKGGMHFVTTDKDAYPNRSPHVFTHNQTNAVRLWMPCVDSYGSRCTWGLEITVPRDMRVIAVGKLTEQRVPADNPEKQTWVFRLDVPTVAPRIQFCAGAFESTVDATRPSITSYCLPGRGPLLNSTVHQVSSLLATIEKYLDQPLPYTGLQLVFVEHSYSKVEIGAGIIIMSTLLLHGPRVIDQTAKTRRLLAIGIAAQWFGTFVCFRDWVDHWLYFGLVGYVAEVAYKQLHGQNATRHRFITDMDWVCSSVSENQPLYATNIAHPTELFSKIFFRKSYLVISLFERRVGYDTFQKIVSSLVTPSPPPPPPPPSSSSLSSSHGVDGTSAAANPAIVVLPTPEPIHTQRFFKLAKKVTGNSELKEFPELWVYKKGCPRFQVGFWYNRKDSSTEIAFKQEILSTQDKVAGDILFRVHELEGDQLVANYAKQKFEDELHEFVIPTRQSKKVKPRPRPAPQAKSSGSATTPSGSSANGSGGSGAATDPLTPGGSNSNVDAPMTPTTPTSSQGSSTPGGLSLSSSSTTAANTSANVGINALHLSSQAGFAASPIQWIRVDPDLEWIRKVSFKQPDFMWINQLRHDRSLLAEYEAIEALKNSQQQHPHQPTSASQPPGSGSGSQLTDILDALMYALSEHNMYYEARGRAAHAIAHLTSRHGMWETGLGALLRYFRSHFYMAESGQPKPNDFDNMPMYYVKCAIVEALSNIKDPRGGAPTTPPDAIELLLDLLKNNDNSRNKYDDDYYVATLIRALGNVSTTVDQREYYYSRMIEQVERYLNKERSTPGYQNVVTVACLHTLCEMQSQQRTELDRELFLRYTRRGNLEAVRLAAYECLLKLSANTALISGASQTPRAGDGLGLVSNSTTAGDKLSTIVPTPNPLSSSTAITTNPVMNAAATAAANAAASIPLFMELIESILQVVKSMNDSPSLKCEVVKLLGRALHGQLNPAPANASRRPLPFHPLLVVSVDVARQLIDILWDMLSASPWADADSRLRIVFFAPYETVRLAINRYHLQKNPDLARKFNDASVSSDSGDQVLHFPTRPPSKAVIQALSGKIPSTAIGGSAASGSGGSRTKAKSSASSTAKAAPSTPQPPPQPQPQPQPPPQLSESESSAAVEPAAIATHKVEPTMPETPQRITSSGTHGNILAAAATVGPPARPLTVTLPVLRPSPQPTPQQQPQPIPPQSPQPTLSLDTTPASASVVRTAPVPTPPAPSAPLPLPPQQQVPAQPITPSTPIPVLSIPPSPTASATPGLGTSSSSVSVTGTPSGGLKLRIKAPVFSIGDAATGDSKVDGLIAMVMQGRRRVKFTSGPPVPSWEDTSSYHGGGSGQYYYDGSSAGSPSHYAASPYGASLYGSGGYGTPVVRHSGARSSGGGGGRSSSHSKRAKNSGSRSRGSRPSGDDDDDEYVVSTPSHRVRKEHRSSYKEDSDEDDMSDEDWDGRN